VERVLIRVRSPATISDRVGQRVRTLKGASLHTLDACVAADHLRQRPCLHLRHEPLQVVQVGAAVREEEPVSVLQVVELKTNQAGEGGSKKSVGVNRDLGNRRWIEIDVVDIPVEQFEPVPHVVAHLQWFLGKRSYGRQVADLAERVIVRDAMVTPPLDVPRHQIASKMSVTFRRVLGK